MWTSICNRTSRITRSERLSDHWPRDTRGLGVHPLVRWCFGAARERPSSRPAVESLQNASSRANSSAHHPAHQLSLFVSFACFADVNSTAHRSAGRGKITTAKDTKYAKVEATRRIHLKRGPSWNPATVCDSKASTAINEEAGKPKSRIDPRAHQSFVPAKTSPLESFFIQRTSTVTRHERIGNPCKSHFRVLACTDWFVVSCSCVTVTITARKTKV